MNDNDLWLAMGNLGLPMSRGEFNRLTAQEVSELKSLVLTLRRAMDRANDIRIAAKDRFYDEFMGSTPKKSR